MLVRLPSTAILCLSRSPRQRVLGLQQSAPIAPRYLDYRLTSQARSPCSTILVTIVACDHWQAAPASRCTNVDSGGEELPKGDDRRARCSDLSPRRPAARPWWYLMHFDSAWRQRRICLRPTVQSGPCRASMERFREPSGTGARYCRER